MPFLSGAALVMRPTTLPSCSSSASYSGSSLPSIWRVAQRPVHATPVVLARYRLLARIAPLLEVDGALVEPGFRGKHAIVDLPAEARRPRAYA